MNDGHAVVDLGDLRPGIAPVLLNLNVASTGSYDLNVTSANSRRLRLGSSDWYVPYSMTIGGNSVNLTGARVISGNSDDGLRSDVLSRSEEHKSEIQSLMRNSYAGFCLKKK